MKNKIKIPQIPFYFARHGKTDWNRDNRVMGQIDIPLNEVGTKQAHVIADKLASSSISHVFSSPLKRAMQTAEIISKSTDTSVTIIEELKNAFAGIIEGKDRGDGTWLEKWRMGGDIQDAEPWSAFVQRVAIGLIKALAHASGKNPVLIVGHGPTFWALLEILDAQTDIEKAENCGVYPFNPPNADSNRWRVEALVKK